MARGAAASVSRGALAAAAMLALASTAVSAVQVAVDMKALVLSTKPAGAPELHHITTVLEGAGIPYDVLDVVSDPTVHGGGLLPLKYPDGNRGKYYSIFLESRQLGYEIAQGTWGSALTAAQWLQLDTYQAQFSVRSVTLYSWPWFDGCVTADGGLPSTLATVDEVFATNDGAYLSHANGGGDLNTIHSWVTPADCSGSVTVRSVARFHAGNPNDPAGQGGSAMAVQTLATGGERLHFFFIPTTYHASQIAVLNLAVQWSVRGLFLGERRLNLAMQIDDLFLDTPEWSLANPIEDDEPEGGLTRITAVDMQRLAAYQAEASAQLPAGSNIKYEWALNGQGVEENGGLGTDGLAAAAQAQRDDFWWVSHTFTHPNLDPLNRAQCTAEITQNSDFVDDLWGPTLPSTWSSSDLVPPSISGLFNGPCLAGLQDAGIWTVVGDNSRAELIPTTYGGSLYHGIWTDGTINGITGTFIIPRFATNIFYNNAIAQNNLDHFNALNPSLNWSWEDLMEYEGSTVTRWMLQWRHDPYMFHQSNALFVERAGWAHTGGWASLLSLWTQTVIDHLKPYTALPVVSWRQSEMKRRLVERMERDACGIDARVVVQDGVNVQVVAKATAGNCKMALSGVAPGSSAYESETYGSEHTVYAQLFYGGNEVSINTGSSAPPPVCTPTCDAAHGTCDTDADPPACVCDLGYGGADCSSPVTAWGANFLSNAGFEVQTSAGTGFAYWYNWVLGGATVGVHDTPTGDDAVAFSVTAENELHALYQVVPLLQSHPNDIRLSGWSKATGVSGIRDGYYSVYMDVIYTDGEWKYGVVAPFDVGTHGWQYSDTVFTPAKTVREVWVYAMFSNHAGSVLFDDLSVQQTVPPEGGPLTTDGRCGFNSPYNSVCHQGSCCSNAGWCQTTCGTVPPPEYHECSECWGLTSGPCKSSNGVCWQLDASTGSCPAGTVPCDEVQALNAADSTVVEANLLLEGITEDALTDELQNTLEDTIADAAGSGDGTVGVASVDAAPDASTATSRRRVQERASRRLSDGLAAAQCRVLAIGAQTVRVRIVLAAGADGPAGEDIIANLKHSLSSGDLETALEANGLGVTPSLIGEPQVVPTGGRAAGVDMGTFAGAVIAATCLGLCVGAAGIACRRSGDRPQRDYVSRVDRSTVGKSDSVRKIQLPRIGSGSRGREGGKYDNVGPTGERADLLRARASADDGDEPIGTVTPRDSEA
mmetsp:Transcript_22059/g.77316  ORF Transcript_22059/g.77316 Transcript_22059/m.77316 type:complete len:1217 (-) Transcript_22059:7684-11334(-)